MVDDIKIVLNRIKELIQGRSLLPPKAKYVTFLLCTATVHLFFCISMGALNNVILCYYNIFAVLFYLFLALVLSPREKYIGVMLLTLIEIEFHSSLATYLLGWNWGFMFYTTALIPANFYLANVLESKRRRIEVASICSMGIVVCYFALNILMGSRKPLMMRPEYDHMRWVMSGFNTILAFIIQLIFSILFALEARYFERQLEKENEKLELDASIDPLTKLLNRRSMTKYMEETLSNLDPNEDNICLIMCDIDDFKRVNDNYGHDVGDIVLKEISEIIKSEVRSTDRVCRWGGEEILLLVHGDRDEIYAAAWRICNKVSEHWIRPDNELPFCVTITMGVAQYESGMVLRTLINKADEMMYYGKNHGKNQVVI